ncbi:hypothetical protein GCM10025734_71060 [Kitasatospora paranensis]
MEITGPPERRMTVNALDSGAQVRLADFEDATAPTWHNIVSGQLNLLDAIERRIDDTAPDGRRYRVGDSPATIVVRPRGWHLDEADLLIDGRPAVAALVDLGLYQFHCRRREHAAGLNAGRWDHLFSLIKNFAGHGRRYVLPDRAQVTMGQPFLRACTDLLVRTCQRRGAHAIGGMAAAVPSRDREANAAALAKVRLDKEREAGDGFDGSWVAHPGLVATCRAVFDGVLGGRPHQLDRRREDVAVTAADLLAVHRTPGYPTHEGVRSNVAVALRYLTAWLGGSGAVAVSGLMEDVATAEIARCQLWQWQHHCSRLTGGAYATGT